MTEFDPKLTRVLSSPSDHAVSDPSSTNIQSPNKETDISSNNHLQYEETNDSNPKIDNKCDICGKIYKYMRCLISHMKKFHNTTDLFFCDHCEFKHIRKSGLAQHIQSKHQNSRVDVYTCKTCSRIYRLKNSLNKHIRYAHGKAASFIGGRSRHKTQRKQIRAKPAKLTPKVPQSNTCKICSKTYMTIGNFRRHLKLEHSTEFQIFRCNSCKYSSKIKCRVKKHTETVHGIPYDLANSKTFECEICKEIFMTRYNFLFHWNRKHVDAKIFCCHFCNQIFKRKDHIEWHIQKEHNALYDPDNLQVKNHQCKNCNKIYKNKHHLVRHLKLECGKSPSFFCNYCKYAGKRKDTLSKHMKKVHSKQ